MVTPPLHRSTDTKRPWRSESREVALLDLRAVKLLDRSALRDWMDVAQAKGHLDCVEVLKGILADAKYI